jgi:hypothetical protein
MALESSGLMKAQISLLLPYNGSSQLFAYTGGYARSIGISEIAVQRNGDGRMEERLNLLPEESGVMSSAFARGLSLSCHNIRILGMVAHSIQGLGDDCMHGIKAELCKHAEAEDSLFGTKGRDRGEGGSALMELGLVPPLELNQGPCAQKYI